ncbi:MAG: N-acetylmuramoyl-L-alanine amidase [Clostridia bacterium]|jgi:N-acetylmuramoyl-L-alanine amidase CwlA|nr:N-acetylmuramoyl-L-alanine amidase [Clostridia bacterium]
MNIKQDLITINQYSRPSTKLKPVKGVVVHWVANTKSTAQANRNYFEGLKAGKRDVKGNLIYASAHYIVGLEGEVIQVVPDNEMCYHVGAASYKTDKLGTYPNDCTIGIECCHVDDNGTMSAATLESLKELIKALCTKYQLDPVRDVYLHYDVTGKACHKYYVNNPKAWTDFKASLQVDPVHAANVNKLVKAGIISTPEAWYGLQTVNIEHVKSLIAKVAAKVS